MNTYYIRSTALQPSTLDGRLRWLKMKRAIRALPAYRSIPSTRTPRTPRWRSSRPAMSGPRPLLQLRPLHLHPIVAAPLILTGLFVALWTWKCAMLVVFQNAIIYNPFMPPNARSMRIEDFARECGRVRWREERIRSLDGTEIALCVSQNADDAVAHAALTRQVYILYFQGNASSLPPRLPDLSRILQRLQDADTDTRYTLVGVSYRGYWTSHDRPSEPGINQDAEAALRWLTKHHNTRCDAYEKKDPIFILYGQSIGCGFASNLAATTKAAHIHALVLETPFTNTRAMLTALYPQKWLPYRHLWPFLRNHLDSWTNLGSIAKVYADRPPGVYLIEAGKDELVPAEHGELLFQRCQDVGLPVERHKVRNALHNEAIVRPAGKIAIAQSIASAVTRGRVGGSQSS